MNTENVTGVMIQYYKICHRRLWFYINHINMAYTNENVKIGKQIHERSYSHERKELRSDNMVFDYVKKNKKGELEIHEVKKSSSLSTASKYQLYFYMYQMKDYNPNIKGVINYPEEKKTETIFLTDEIIEELTGIIYDIKRIGELECPPLGGYYNYCKSCSYYDFCKV